MKRQAADSSNSQDKTSKLLFNKQDDFVNNLKKFKKDGSVEADFKPAWIDEDDNGCVATEKSKVKDKDNYSQKLKQKYETLMGTPSWAKITESNVSDPGDNIALTIGHIEKKTLKVAKSRLIPQDPQAEFVPRLRRGAINIKREPNINSKTHNEGRIISCVQFHPTSSVAMVMGKQAIVSLFSIGKSISQKLHSVKLRNWKRRSSAFFTPDGKEAFLVADYQTFFYVYDLIKGTVNSIDLPKTVKRPEQFQLSPDGKYIVITNGQDIAYLICAKSKELLKYIKQNENIASLAFTPDCKHVYFYGKTGTINVWDITTNRSVKKFQDHGCVNASRITISPCSRLLATGSSEGIVNVYRMADITSAEPLPEKTISNLTTAITLLKFNPTTEILAVASNKLPGALKLIHIPSYTAFGNFPQKDSKINTLYSLAFSPNSGYMALGDDKGSAHLYRLQFYKNY